MNTDSTKLKDSPTPTSRLCEFRLSWRFVSLWSAGVSIFAYTCFALLLFGMTSSNGPQVTLSDCFLYPWRRTEIRLRQGAYLIENAHAEARRGRYSSAFPMFASGLAKEPANWTSRLYFARLLLNVDSRDSARRLLDEGLNYSSDEPRYIDGVLILAAQLQDHALRLKACENGLIASRARSDRIARIDFLKEQKVFALLAVGRTKEALTLLSRHGLDASAEEAFLRGETLLKLNLTSEASRSLADWTLARGSNPAVLGLLARALREAGDLAGMEATLARARFEYPDDPSVLAELVSNRVLAGNTTGAAAAMNRFFTTFYGNPDNLVILARVASRINDVTLLAACIDEANRLGYAGIGLRELMVELRTGRGEWAAAEILLGEIAHRRSDFNLPAGRWQVFYTRLVAAALQPDKLNQFTFLELLREERPQPAAFERVIQQLDGGGRRATADAVAKMAQVRYPELRDWSAYARELDAESAHRKTGNSAEEKCGPRPKSDFGV